MLVVCNGGGGVLSLSFLAVLISFLFPTASGGQEVSLRLCGESLVRERVGEWESLICFQSECGGKKHLWCLLGISFPSPDGSGSFGQEGSLGLRGGGTSLALQCVYA